MLHTAFTLHHPTERALVGAVSLGAGPSYLSLSALASVWLTFAWIPTPFPEHLHLEHLWPLFWAYSFDSPHPARHLSGEVLG